MLRYRVRVSTLLLLVVGCSRQADPACVAVEVSDIRLPPAGCRNPDAAQFAIRNNCERPIDVETCSHSGVSSGPRLGETSFYRMTVVPDGGAKIGLSIDSSDGGSTSGRLICYGTDSQNLPWVAEVEMPSLSVSRRSVDFGVAGAPALDIVIASGPLDAGFFSAVRDQIEPLVSYLTRYSIPFYRLHFLRSGVDGGFTRAEASGQDFADSSSQNFSTIAGQLTTEMLSHPILSAIPDAFAILPPRDRLQPESFVFLVQFSAGDAPSSALTKPVQSWLKLLIGDRSFSSFQYLIYLGTSDCTLAPGSGVASILDAGFGSLFNLCDPTEPSLLFVVPSDLGSGRQILLDGNVFLPSFRLMADGIEVAPKVNGVRQWELSNDQLWLSAELLFKTRRVAVHYETQDRCN
jgi:hypothetical protein